MLIRKGTEEDIPQIIQLLKESLGESLMPKSEAFWRWKHEQNPFGKSPVLLAEDERKLVGIRTFLRWEFQDQNQTILSGRAVDTAIHPAYQGKGLFTQLTLKLLEELQNEGVQFIFNTPNEKSLPGYLKMGWQTWGKLPLKIKLKVPRKSKEPLPPSDWSQVALLIKKIESEYPIQSGIHTRLVPGYLNWRYMSCPITDYQYLSDGDTFLLIYRLKDGKKGKELRITDLYTLPNFKKQELQKQFKELSKKSGAVWISFSGLTYDSEILNLGSVPILTQGPLVTLRKLQDRFDPRFLDWKWSLGDLELF
ncbi:GNAT family N-acetyltransferase [Algoriphagus kandeliae]|uniref:GNAT family N-acetyltransferase n=1 Tax=Algoriphagus kandeliae TaxID=2562278 RepID=A0A4Y9R1A2_9BACT|nr:GNAT family N-acetyltransferase [Algoriphagus kandeliae]TFV97273.1 GNAT family N-acetyltransferase [Algoriphagus kandeliae]